MSLDPPGQPEHPSEQSTFPVRQFADGLGQGLLFVWMGAPDAADPAQLPLVPALEENSKSWTIQDTFRDLPMDAVTLLENVLDVSHVPFTHHKTVGKRENASPVEASIIRESAEGFEAFWRRPSSRQTRLPVHDLPCPAADVA